MKTNDAESSEIDFSDIAEMTDEQLAQLQPSHLRNPANYRPVKKKISIYVEADVLEHFKSKGKGYQTTINRVLRQSMLSEAEPHYGTHKPDTADDKP
ncbi:BrnA antitoxin family protein [Sphaerochaeta sp.]|uniref:BrnA antitoxin family protein n=1 Tax=Sphaerochaeta sp. TaxID=1972642 RepID=UPI00258F9A0F|nr:BrnA antitoxin family protein [Sphaerochaeta sp.]MDD3457100.1 BrnA antitoxin family protein [Sphaerochaeta sp.]